MGREDQRRPRHEISCQVQELQDILAAANQLERLPDCEVKKALEADIKAYLNPSKRSDLKPEILALERRSEVVEYPLPAKTSPISKEVDDADWSPDKTFLERVRSYWPIILVIVLVVVLVFASYKSNFG